MAPDSTQADKPTDVLLVVDDDTFDRMNVIVRHLCVGMMDEPIRMRVLAWNRHPVSDNRIGPIEVFYPPRRGWIPRDPQTEAISDVLRDAVPDVVHCLSAASARRMASHVDAWNAHLVVHLTDTHDLEAFAPLARRAEVTAVLTTGALARLFRKRYLDTASASLVPLGLPASGSPACLSRPERVPAFVVTRSLTRDCGLDLLLKAWKDVVHLGQETQLFILGQGPAERHFRRLMEKYDLRSHVTFAGQMGTWTNLSEAMRGADFYVVPDPPERFTMGILYAMAWGLTVIAPTGLTEDCVIDGETALLFTPRSADDLRDKILALLNDHRQARKLAHGGQDYVRAHHQASAMVREMAALYRAARGAQRKPSSSADTAATSNAAS